MDSFSRNSSPRGSVHSSFYRHSAVGRGVQPSARLLSQAFISQSTLPSFLRVPLSSFGNLQSKNRLSVVSETKSVRSQRLSENAPRLEGDKLKVGEEWISRRELLNLRGNGAISTKLVEVLMGIFKDVNSELIRSEEGHDRVLIHSPSFSSNLLTSHDAPRSEVNVFKYDILLFPLLQNYWTLIYLDLRERKVMFIDPKRKNNGMQEKLIKLFGFLKNELMIHENRRIEDTSWRGIVFENYHLTEAFDDEDTAVFVCTLAMNIALGREESLTPKDLSKYRDDLLKLIYINCSKNQY